MNHLFSTAILLLMLAPQGRKLPDEFYRIPEQVRERATVILSGTYGQGRTPCFWMPDGSREWFVDSWFDVKRVYRGEVVSELIRINTAMLPNVGYVKQNLQRGRKYLVLLRPSEESLETIKSGEVISFWDALCDDEIVAIVELK